MEAILLGILVLLDAVFAGFRASAGRNARIYKLDYYLRASWLGFGVGGLAIGIAAAPVAFSLLHATAPERQLSQYLDVARNLLWVFAPYATLVLTAMALWTYPHPRIRTLASVLVLGPLTFLRRPVIVAGLLLALLMASEWTLRLACLFAVCIQLGIEPVLNGIHTRLQRTRQAQQIALRKKETSA